MTIKNSILPFLLVTCMPFAAVASNAWYTVFGVEAGAAISSHAGKSKTFPIENPASDQFYAYNAQHSTHTSAIYGGFLGTKWKGSSSWNIQLDARYNQASPFTAKGLLTQGVDSASEDTYDYSYKILIRQLLAEGKFSYVGYSRLQPYAVIGLGSSFNKSYAFATTVPDSLTFTRVYKNHSTPAFTYAVGAGLDIPIVKYFSAGIGYRFTNFGKASLGSASIDGTAVSGTLSQENFYANEVFAQFAFTF